MSCLSDSYEANSNNSIPEATRGTFETIQNIETCEDQHISSRRQSTLSTSSLPTTFKNSSRKFAFHDLQVVLTRKLHRTLLVESIRHHKQHTAVMESQITSKNSIGMKNASETSRKSMRRNALDPIEALKIQKAFVENGAEDRSSGFNTGEGWEASPSQQHVRDGEHFVPLLGSFEFPIFSCSKNDLQYCAAKLLLQYFPNGFKEHVVLPPLIEFVTELSLLYNDIPYHGFRHAFDVCQMMHYLLSNYLVNHKDFQDPISRFGLMLAALTHDTGHFGRTNMQLRSHEDPLCDEYGLNSTLERMHANKALTLLQTHKVMLFLSSTQQTVLYEHIAELILATDMEQHSTYMRQAAIVNEAIQKPFPKKLSHSMLVKFCDVSNVCRTFTTATRWGLMLQDEQTAADLRLGHNGGVQGLGTLGADTSNQRTISFVKSVVQPMISSIGDFHVEMAQELQTRAAQNIRCWEAFDKVSSSTEVCWNPAFHPTVNRISNSISTANNLPHSQALDADRGNAGGRDESLNTSGVDEEEKTSDPSQNANCSFNTFSVQRSASHHWTTSAS